jgi:hypothetical protein
VVSDDGSRQPAAAAAGNNCTVLFWPFPGASPNRRDHGRRLCAEEWARFCGRHSCADAIQKYIRSTKYFFAKTFLLAKDKWKSEPDLLQLQEPAVGSPTVTTAAECSDADDDCDSPTVTTAGNADGGNGSGGNDGPLTTSTPMPVGETPHRKGSRRDSGGWIQRHLSLTDRNGNSVGGWIQRHLSLKRKKHQPQVGNTSRECLPPERLLVHARMRLNMRTAAGGATARSASATNAACAAATAALLAIS